MVQSADLILTILILTILILVFSSCSNEEINPTKSKKRESINQLSFDSSEIETKYNKEIKIYDETGDFYEVANLGGDDEKLINDYLDVTNFSLKQVYESSEKNIQSSNPNKGDAFPSKGNINMKFKELNLDENALGFAIETTHEIEDKSSSKINSWTYVIDYDSPDRWMYWGKVEQIPTSNQNSDVQVWWYYRPCSLCSMEYDWSETLGPNEVSIYHNMGERRIRAKIWSNWQNYRVYFTKWEEDSWDREF